MNKEVNYIVNEWGTYSISLFKKMAVPLNLRPRLVRAGGQQGW